MRMRPVACESMKYLKAPLPCGRGSARRTWYAQTCSVIDIFTNLSLSSRTPTQCSELASDRRSKVRYSESEGVAMRILRTVIAAAALLVAAVPVFAHHSFTMFDMTQRITLNGTVTAF